MKFFPMFLRMEDRRVVIVGDGETAAQKLRLMAKTEARVELLGVEPCAELARALAAGKAQQASGAVTPALFDGAALVFLATGCPGCDAALYPLVREARAVVNTVDQPDLCEATTPSIVDRDPLVVAIGTEGAAPILGRQLKTRIEEFLEPGLGQFVAAAGSLRDRVGMRIAKDDRRAFWRWVFARQPRQLVAQGDVTGAIGLIEAAIETGTPEGGQGGLLSVIPAGTADLITLRAVQRLQEADLIVYDRLSDPTLLEQARRDAERAVSADPAVVADTLADGGRVVWLQEARVEAPLGALHTQASAAGATLEVLPAGVA